MESTSVINWPHSTMPFGSCVSMLQWVLLLCACCTHICPARSSGIKDVPNNAAALQIQGPRGWLPADVTALKLTFSPPLEQGVDFSIWTDPSNHMMPEKFHIRHSPTLLHVLLSPGKRWVKDMPPQKNFTQELRLVRIRNGQADVTGYKRGSAAAAAAGGGGGVGGQQDVVARITPDSPRVCPSHLTLPGASKQLQSRVDQVLRHCQAPLFIPSRELKWKHHRSLPLLLLQPAMLFVNGSDQDSSGSGGGSGDQNMLRAAKSVDRFLAAHSVLDVAWEPMSADEPQFWILVPRPLGMPGHLFAAMDALQWRHPLVSATARGGGGRGGGGGAGAICEHTMLAGITGSGYSADAFNVYNFLREGFMRNLPVQAFPSTLGKRSTKPSHSPCPPVRHDVRDNKLNRGERAVNRSRLAMYPIRNIALRPEWWTPLVGKPSKRMPERSIRDLDQMSVPSRMVFYSYMFRPNFFIRQKIEQMVKDFQLSKKEEGGGVSATMHVRRGDVLLHKGQARFYIPLKSYVQGALPFIKILGVTTILLLTDSQVVIDEALACEKDFPDICGGLSWRFVQKKRWYGAEGGWENPFPSGSAVEEFANIQLEFALAQQSDLMIMGNSGYGELVFNHMCCKFPLHPRGYLPQRCFCPPKIRLEQGGFTCKTGNKIMCDHKDRGGNVAKSLSDPANMRGANFSHTQDAFKSDVKVWVTVADVKKGLLLGDVDHQFMLSDMATDARVQKLVSSLSQQAKEQVCFKNKELSEED